MRRQTFDRIKKTLTILLAVLFLASLTASAGSAAKAAGSCKRISYSCSQAEDGTEEGTYKISCNSKNSDGDTYKWDFGDGEDSTEKNPSHEYNNCNDHTVTLTVNKNDGTESTKNMGTY